MEGLIHLLFGRNIDLGIYNALISANLYLFTNYDKVLLSFEVLHKTFYNKAAYKEQNDKLSSVENK